MIVYKQTNKNLNKTKHQSATLPILFYRYIKLKNKFSGENANYIYATKNKKNKTRARYKYIHKKKQNKHTQMTTYKNENNPQFSMFYATYTHNSF